MGTSLSVLHEVSETEEEEVKAVMLFQYQDPNLIPISCLEFIRHPNAFSTWPLILVEQRTGRNPEYIEYKEHSESLVLFHQVFHKYFRVGYFSLPNKHNWVISRRGVNMTEALKAENFVRESGIQFVSHRAVKVSSVFSDSTSFSTLFSAITPERTDFAPQTALFSRRPKLSSQSLVGPLLSIDTSAAPPPLLTVKPITQGGVSPFQCSDCDEIVPGLWIGNEHAAVDDSVLQQHHITHIVNLNPSSSPIAFPDKYEYFAVNLKDCVFEILGEEFFGALEFVNEAVDRGGCVLIHCRKGKSRSAALCIAYLMRHRHMQFSEAMDLVTSKRPSVSINEGFLAQLTQLQV